MSVTEKGIRDIPAYVQVGNAKELPFGDNSFDLMLAIDTIHNLPVDDCG